MGVAALILTCGCSEQPPGGVSSDAGPDADGAPVDRPTRGEGFFWGETNQSGLALGLRVEGPGARAGEVLRYHLALFNHTDRPRRIRLFNDLDGYARTRLVLRSPGGSEHVLGRAVGWKMPSSSGLGISVELGPHQAKELVGEPLTLAPGLTGEIMLVLGGTPDVDFEIRSGAVQVAPGLER